MNALHSLELTSLALRVYPQCLASANWHSTFLELPISFLLRNR